MASAPIAREATDLTKERSLSLYRRMYLIRRCEEQLAQAYKLGLSPGHCHTYVGEEAGRGGGL